MPKYDSLAGLTFLVLNTSNLFLEHGLVPYVLHTPVVFDIAIVRMQANLRHCYIYWYTSSCGHFGSMNMPVFYQTKKSKALGSAKDSSIIFRI